MCGILRPGKVIKKGYETLGKVRGGDEGLGEVR